MVDHLYEMDKLMRAVIDVLPVIPKKYIREYLIIHKVNSCGRRDEIFDKYIRFIQGMSYQSELHYKLPTIIDVLHYTKYSEFIFCNVTVLINYCMIKGIEINNRQTKQDIIESILHHNNIIKLVEDVLK